MVTEQYKTATLLKQVATPFASYEDIEVVLAELYHSFMMSLVRVAARLPLRSCLQTANAACQRNVTKQNTFEGVFNAYLWDEQTGFGQAFNGKTVLVAKEFDTGGDLSKCTEGQFWQEIIDPTSYLDHGSLRDELQMNVLSYDDDALHQDLDQAMTGIVPIFKGEVELSLPSGDLPPSGQTAGFNGGPRTATA